MSGYAFGEEIVEDFPGNPVTELHAAEEPVELRDAARRDLDEWLDAREGVVSIVPPRREGVR